MQVKITINRCPPLSWQPSLTMPKHSTRVCNETSHLASKSHHYLVSLCFC